MAHSRSLVVYPLLLAAYPVLSLLATNVQETPPGEALRALALAVAGCLALLVLLRTVLKDWHRAALGTALLVVAFFSYGHIYFTLERLALWGVQLGRHRYLLPLGLSVCGIILCWLWVRKPDLRAATSMLNLLAAVLLTFPLISLGTSVARLRSSPSGYSPASLGLPTPLAAPLDQPAPDIYYIILDSYARADYMDELFGYDNSEFIRFLESRGFYVASQSHSNHTSTGLSLSSSLNMRYAQDLGLELLPHTYPSVVAPAIRHSLVRQLLEQAGYQVAAMSSGWTHTEIIDADTYFTPDQLDLRRLRGPMRPNRFETQLVQTTTALALTDRVGPEWQDRIAHFADFPAEALRRTILAAFDNLPIPATDPAPQFVFAHIISPHKPYIFGPNGEPIEAQGAFTFAETDGAPSSDREAYHDQAVFVTKKIEVAIDEILRQSNTPPIIILQADHGFSGASDAGGVSQRTAILNAYLVPSRCRDLLYPNITPVNTFRVVFNCSFGTSLPLLPDQVYFTPSPRENPSEFQDVTDQVTHASPSP